MIRAAAYLSRRKLAGVFYNLAHLRETAAKLKLLRIAINDPLRITTTVEGKKVVINAAVELVVKSRVYPWTR